MKILVTGGAGFIGSHVVDACLEAGHDVAVLERERPEMISHHAAQMDVRRSVADPVFDAQVNLIGLLNLLEEGRRCGLQGVVFASSGGTVYGAEQRLPASEDDPTAPICPYGVSKLGSERYLHYYGYVYGMRWVALRYGNVYGPRQDPRGEAGVVAIFAGPCRSGGWAPVASQRRWKRRFTSVSIPVPMLTGPR